MKSLAMLALFALLVAGCHAAEFFAPAEDAGLNVRMTLTKGCLLPAPCLTATEEGIVYTLGLTNGSSQRIYLRPCGASVNAREELWENGAWQMVGPAVLCAQGPASISIEPGAGWSRAVWLQPGIRRFVVSVSLAADLAGEQPASTASERVP